MTKAIFATVIALCAATSTPTFADSQAEIALAKHVLNGLQAKSFKSNREYCGYIGLDEDGTLISTKAKRGRKASCLAREPYALEIILASYHTHGAYDGDEGHEVPSVSDIEGDEDEGIDGYVATPGGRFWYIDTEDMVIIQLCGIGCLDQDPDYTTGADADIEISYTYDELVEFFEEE